jgi:predicted O-methyltransferase YrrM
MIEKTFKQEMDIELCKDAILNNDFKGFKEDYLILHTLIRKHKPVSILEIGTNMGTGTKIIKNAIGAGQVFSLDLPTEMAHKSLQHPINEGKGDKVGSRCNLPFTQLRGDSMTFDFSKNPCEAYFIDGEHDYAHPMHETMEVLKNNPKLVIYHDSDIDVVYKGIMDGFWKSPNGNKYTLTRVTGTRIAYALRNEE